MREEELKIDDYLSRPGRYVNIDGSNELMWGAILCVFSSFDWLQSITPRGSLLLHQWVFMLYCPAMILLIHFSLKAFKNRVTYPRTGYVAYPVTPRTRSGPYIAFVVGAVAAIGAAAVIRSGLRVTVLVGATNIAFYVVAARPLRPWKYGFVILIACGALWIPDAHGLIFYGLCFLASGLTTLILYLRQTRRAV